MPVQKQSWSLVILCYNEMPTLDRVVDSARRVLRKMAPGRYEIIIVDDGSVDGTQSLILKLVKQYPEIRPIHHSSNLGIGMALRSGYYSSKCENVCVIPGDGQFNVHELLPFKTVENGTFVSFFRKKQEGYSLFRLFISKFNKGINRVLFGMNLQDVNWVKIYKRSELSKLDLKLQSSLIESEICAKMIKRGNGCIQCPSVYFPRAHGKAKGGSFKIIITALWELLKLTRAVWAYSV